MNQQVHIDLGLLYDVCGSDHATIQTMLSMFLNNMPGSLAKLDEAIQQKDYDAIYKAAHFMKSSLSVIKVEEMYNAVVDICAKARQQEDYPGICTLATALHQLFNSSIPLLNQHIH